MAGQLDFTGKVALVTGAGRGLGRSIAEAFAARGASVAANDITPINLDLTLQRILAGRGVARDYVADISKRMPAQNMVDQILDHFGRIDFLVNNAAVHPRASILDFDEWDWRRTVDVNLVGPFFMIQLVGRVMQEQGGGAIVNITGESRLGEEKGQSAFLASKMGLVGLTRAAAAELSEYHIRLNGVCPCEVQEAQAMGRNGKQLAGLDIAGVLRPGEDEIVALILFLCSQAAGQINGLVVDAHGRLIAQ